MGDSQEFKLVYGEAWLSETPTLRLHPQHQLTVCKDNATVKSYTTLCES